jgi:hypothetical protein
VKIVNKTSDFIWTNIALTVTIAIASLFRWMAARGDLWLDEVWSCALVRQVDASVIRVVQVAHDNSHLLNSIWLCFAGEHPSPIVARFPSLLAACALVPLMWRAALGDSKRERLTATSFVGLSVPIIVIGTEARGYGVSLLFGMAGWILCRTGLGTSVGRCALAGFCLTVSILAHFSSIFLYGAVAIFSLASSLLGAFPRAHRWWLRLFALHVLPAATVGFVYFFYLRRMMIGSESGGDFDLPSVVREWLRYTTGIPHETWWWAAVAILGFLVARGLWALAQEGRHAEMIFFFALLILPLVSALALRAAAVPQPPPALRYYLIQIPFIYILCAHALWRPAARSPAPAKWGPFHLGSLLPCIVVALFLTGQTWVFFEWLPNNRGTFAKAAKFLESKWPEERVGLASNHPFRNRLLLRYYGPPVERQRWVLLSDDQLPEEPRDWFLFYEPRTNVQHDAVILDGNGHRYRLARAFPFGGISGATWLFYQNAQTHPAAP